MSRSPNPHFQARFFGLDLGALWHELFNAWRGMLAWPVLSWLWPQPAVCLHLPSGEQALSRSLHSAPLHDAGGARSARFNALLLPENLLLRRTLDLPKLQAAELQAALVLEIRSLSPFVPDELTWTHEIGLQDGSLIRVHVVLSSRKLIAQHILAVHPQLQSQDAEVWAARLNASGFVLLPGFGEVRRQRQSAAGGWASAALALLILTLIAVMAVSPSVKLYLRSKQADQALQALQQKAGPVISQRESLVRMIEQLASLELLSRKMVAPLPVLKIITEALPDDTSLLSLQVQGPKVSITGQTANAASLMKQLGGTAGLRDVKAPIAATKPLGAPRESFTIEFMLDPARSKPAP